MKRLRSSSNPDFPFRNHDELLVDPVPLGSSAFTLPRSRCQVGISTIDGIRRSFATRSDCKQSPDQDRKSTRLNSSHPSISYAVFCLKKQTAAMIKAAS